jgi:hypothetical protein
MANFIYDEVILPFSCDFILSITKFIYYLCSIIYLLLTIYNRYVMDNSSFIVILPFSLLSII